MLIVDACVDRLRSVSMLREVGTALELASITERPPRQFPAAYVIPLSANVTGNRRSTGPVSQMETETLGVVFVLQQMHDPRGLRAGASVSTLRTSLREALHGWTPSGKYTPFELAGGELITLAGGLLWWVERFTSTHQEESSNG